MCGKMSHGDLTTGGGEGRVVDLRFGFGGTSSRTHSRLEAMARVESRVTRWTGRGPWVFLRARAVG